MKIRNKSRKIDISKIFIEKDYYGGTNISFVINNQYHEIYLKSIYIDSILKEIEKFTNIIGG